MIERFNRILFVLTRYVAWLGMLSLLGAMAVTTADIILRKTEGEGIFGAVDIVQLLIMGAAFLAIPHGFITRSHVSISLVVDMLPPPAVALAGVLAAALGTAFMLAIAVFGYDSALMQYDYGDVSLTLGVPKIYYWVPLLFGAGLSVVVTVHMTVEQLYLLFSGRRNLLADEE